MDLFRNSFRDSFNFFPNSSQDSSRISSATPCKIIPGVSFEMSPGTSSLIHSGSLSGNPLETTCGNPLGPYYRIILINSYGIPAGAPFEIFQEASSEIPVRTSSGNSTGTFYGILSVSSSRIPAGTPPPEEGTNSCR